MKKMLVFLIFSLFFVNHSSAQEILDAVKVNDFQRIKTIVEEDPTQVKFADGRNCTALHYASDKGNIEIVEYLIVKGADIMAKDVDGDTPLHWAAFQGNNDIAKLLLDKGADINAPNNRGRAPLHTAATADKAAIAMYLIEKGADINAMDRFLTTPLKVAGLEVAKILVEKGVDVNIFPDGTLSALEVALLFGKKEVADYLLDQGAKIFKVGTPDGMRFVTSALRIGCIKYFDKCLQQGLDPLVESEMENTLLHYAAAGNSTELINKLIDLGVSINPTNLYGWTPLHTAAYNGNQSVVELFIQKGLDKNTRTIAGKTPYNLANEANKTELADYLITQGADQSAPKFPVLKGEYFGQPKPGKKAVPFAPGIVAAGNDFHGSITFTPDGNEAYWSQNGLINSKRINGKWTMPDATASISAGDVPFISPDGNKFYFMGRKQVQGGSTFKEVICVRDKTPTGWSEPYFLPDVINSIPGIHWQMSVDSKGNLYFGVRQEGSGIEVIYYSEYKDGTYSEPEIIESLREVPAHSPYIAPDGSYLIISGYEDGHALFILFKKKDGTWTNGRSLSDIIGSGSVSPLCPIVTPDGKYLFFVGVMGGKWIPFWVDASFIEELRKTKLLKRALQIKKRKQN